MKKFYYFPNHGDDEGNNSYTIAYGNPDDDLDAVITGAEDNEEDAIEACKRLNKIHLAKDYIGSVREFHEMFEHPVGTGPSHVEPREIRSLRIKLLFEELGELAEAGDVMGTFTELCSKAVATVGIVKDGDNVDKKEELDALCDIQYVLAGKILTSGLHTVFDKNFALVHLNNMNKAHSSKEHAYQTAEKLQDGKDNWATVLERNGRFIVLNRDKKVIKPHDHKKVELSLDEES